MSGTLFIVATPIGNLADASARSLEVLRTADLVACEDTRTTRTLLTRYGIDTPSRSELIAATHTTQEITEFLEADSVGYLSMEGLMAAVGSGHTGYCSSCYTGVYPVAFPRDEKTYLQLALKLDREPVAN